MASVTSYNVEKTEEQNIHREQKMTVFPGFFNEILNWASQRDVHWFVQACKPCVLLGGTEHFKEPLNTSKKQI